MNVIAEHYKAATYAATLDLGDGPNVFLDIGAYEGETLEAVVGMGFDRIYSFEPMPEQFAELERRYGDTPNVTLLNYGLSDRTGKRNLYGTNEFYEASIYPGSSTAVGIDTSAVTVCDFVSAAEWFKENLTDEDKVRAKINCEGSEVDIFDSLVESEEIWKLHAVTICFDVEHIPGQEQRAWKTREDFDRIGFNLPRWHLFGAARGTTHQDRLIDWLVGTL